MRIGMICYPSYGGSGVVATELGKQLAFRGHEVHFISYERPFKLDLFHENIIFHEVDIVDYPLFKFPPYSMALASKIYEVAKWAGLDLLHVHYAIPHAVSAYLAKQMLKGELELPVITTLHGTDITIVGLEKQFYDITRFAIQSSDGVTAVSRSLRDETLRRFKLNRQIEVIYNFVDPEEYRRLPCPQLKKRFTDGEDKLLIHISNFRPVKRLKDVVDLFALVNSKIPSKLLLVGDGPDGSYIHEYVRKIGLLDRVFFLGKQERVVELLSISDLCLLPSEKESFGLVALEAMACQVPVVGTKVGGLPEVVRDGETGILEKVGNVAAMAERAVKLLSDEESYLQMALESRRHAVNKFHVDDMVTNYLKYYEVFL
ncbi:N-acetyl-alpha-D-glucosaminyl L-malate synthase BshA [Thermincola potens]|uniref:Glycosyl transferase group 1 n=1 Tax=Thermincola potens (strain JR) TaxID=635013 RepID=D5XA46_THEPJ|nr:N-acetyl-alpha-D-glucosaminyl L-malate synthase BshA [Thermincola potens]ADG83179.1 glycosyl transferase group 1 [Thermincola potens JR]